MSNGTDFFPPDQANQKGWAWLYQAYRESRGEYWRPDRPLLDALGIGTSPEDAMRTLRWIDGRPEVSRGLTEFQDRVLRNSLERQSMEPVLPTEPRGRHISFGEYLDKLRATYATGELGRGSALAALGGIIGYWRGLDPRNIRFGMAQLASLGELGGIPTARSAYEGLSAEEDQLAKEFPGFRGSSTLEEAHWRKQVREGEPQDRVAGTVEDHFQEQELPEAEDADLPEPPSNDIGLPEAKADGFAFDNTAAFREGIPSDPGDIANYGLPNFTDYLPEDASIPNSGVGTVSATPDESGSRADNYGLPDFTTDYHPEAPVPPLMPAAPSLPTPNIGLGPVLANPAEAGGEIANFGLPDPTVYQPEAPATPPLPTPSAGIGTVSANPAMAGGEMTNFGLPDFTEYHPEVPVMLQPPPAAPAPVTGIGTVSANPADWGGPQPNYGLPDLTEYHPEAPAMPPPAPPEPPVGFGTVLAADPAMAEGGMAHFGP